MLDFRTVTIGGGAGFIGNSINLRSRNFRLFFDDELRQIERCLEIKDNEIER